MSDLQESVKMDPSEEDQHLMANDDDEESGKVTRERRKIDIRFIQDKSRRHITFSKRKAGIMKKAYELSVLTGTQVLLLVVSETGLVYTFTTPKLQPLVTKPEGKNLIQACLNAPEDSNQDEQEDNSPPPQQQSPPPTASHAAPPPTASQPPSQPQTAQASQQYHGGAAGMAQMPQSYLGHEQSGVYNPYFGSMNGQQNQY